MFRIMKAVTKRDEQTLYEFMTTTVDGVTKPVEITSRDELDKKVDKMLNEEGFSKQDFIVVQITDYIVDARDYKYGGGD